MTTRKQILKRCVTLVFSLTLFAAGLIAEDSKSSDLIEARAALQDGFNKVAAEKFHEWLKGRDKPQADVMEILNLYCRALDGAGRRTMFVR
jgi:hypothetical protein